MKTTNILIVITALALFCGSSLQAQNLSVEGNVGIGTDTPTEKLQVEDGFIKIVNNFPFLRLQSTTDQNAGMEFLNSSGDPGGLIFYSFPTNEIIFSNQGAQHMFIEENGEVGIGTNEPTARLNIDNGAANTSFNGGFLILGNTGVGQKNLGLDDNSIQARLDGGISSLFIQEFGGNTILNQNGGRVGIGTSSPQAQLQILGGSDVNSTDGGYLINGSLTGTNLGIDNNEIQARFNGDASTLFINPEGGDIVMARDGGNVGIGTTGFNNVSLNIKNLTEDNKGLRVETNDSGVGTYFASVDIRNTSTNGTALDVPQGFARKAGGGSWASTSDARTKKDITAYTEGLDILKAINPVWYTYNGKGDTPEGQRFVGVIAQELDKVANHMVIPGQDGYMAVDPSAFTYMLINAVQELDEENEELRSTSEELRNTNTELQEELEGVKTRLAKIEALLGKLTIDNSAIDNSTTDYRPSISTTVLTDAKLEQNQPNPFNGSTTVRYFIPEGIKKAVLRITSIEGKVVKEVVIQARGEGQTTLNATTLGSGTYQYSLFLDNQLLETKQMVLTKN